MEWIVAVHRGYDSDVASQLRHDFRGQFNGVGVHVSFVSFGIEARELDHFSNLLQDIAILNFALVAVGVHVRRKPSLRAAASSHFQHFSSSYHMLESAGQ